MQINEKFENKKQCIVLYYQRPSTSLMVEISNFGSEIQDLFVLIPKDGVLDISPRTRYKWLK